MLKQPGHFTSMKKELGDCTKRLSLCFRFSSLAEGWRRSRTMVFGGDALLGTCVGDTGLLAARAGGAVSRASSWLLLAARRAEKSLETEAAGRGALRRFCVFAAASARRGARPLGRGRPRAAFFELLKSCLQKLVLAGATTAESALAPAVRSAEVRSDARLILAQVSTLTAASSLRPPQASLALVADVVFDRLAA
ncbi:unnamed protein product [Pelagomonas calceolata]|uniref:Uncharacterized protein n=2 Tax=Pelagomonas calceolata TaxID=35677 RepID=A0A8J2SQV7_9STRA|nr:unnamed protein product [Pelagomonas calceolata]